MYKRVLLVFLMTATSTKQKTVLTEADKFSKNVTKISGKVESRYNIKKITQGSRPQTFPFKIGHTRRGSSWAENYADIGHYDEETLYDDYEDDDYSNYNASDPIVMMCQWSMSISGRGLDCDCQQNGSNLICCSKHLPRKMCGISGSPAPILVQHLYIVGLSQPTLDFNNQFIKKLKISPLNLRSVTLRKTNVINLKICDNPEDEFCDNVTKLDLRKNGLASLQLANCSKLHQLFLSDNNWQCIHQQSFPEEGQHLEWLLDKNCIKRWKDESLTNCSSEMRHETWKNNKHERDGWFDENNKDEATNLKKFLTFMKVMRRDCPTSCDCKRENAKVRTVHGKDKKEIFIVGVTCYRLNLTSLPTILPPNTIYLDVTENQISDLFPLLKNQHYKNLRILIVENNHISSMEPLRNSKLEHINLRDNRLSYLDLELLEPILEYQSTRPKNEHELNMLLSWNPWSCPCTHIRTFQNFLEKYHVIIKDAKDIKCQQFQRQQLLDLNYEDICTIKMDWMVILIAIEAFLLVSILVKLTYDIVVYQRSGRLPWVARHLCCSALSSSTWLAGRGQWWTWTNNGQNSTPCSSGYITSSGTSSHIEVQAHKEANSKMHQEGAKQGEGNFLIAKTHRVRENSVVRFL